MFKRILVALLVILLAGLLVIVGMIYALSKFEIPTGEAGPAAEALTDRIEAATRKAAFERLAGVSFTFSVSGDRHFRDLRRGLVEYRTGQGRSEVIVRYSIPAGRWIASSGGQRLTGEEGYAAYRNAVQRHVNDFFWLNPFVTLRAPGAVRKKVGDRALLLEFSGADAGGETPGDSYLIVTDGEGLPVRWHMWTQILPIQGVEFSFTGWREFDGGAYLAPLHDSAVLSVNLENVVTYPTYPVPGEPDRFAPLVAELESP